LADKIEDQIKQNYPGSEVKVFANDFNILVLGQVKTANIRDQITLLVQANRSVKEIWNYLTVNPKPNFSLNKSLIAKVHERIVLEKNLVPENIEIEAVGSTVYLLGRNIGNLTYFDRAIRSIYTLEGVDKVINLTTLGPDDYRSNEEEGF
jgi:osmotically-inducible protein OsmY